MIRTRSLLQSALATALLSAAVWAPGAQASVTSMLDFDGVTPVALNGGESFSIGDYKLTAMDSPLAQAYGFTGGAGQTMDGASSCGVIVACPSGDATRYYAGTNDGAVNITAAANDLQISSLKYAFLAPIGGLMDFTYGQLVLTGTKLNGGIITLSRDFAGQDPLGNFMFDTWDLGADFAREHFASLSISACLFNDTAVCINSATDSPMNQAQFAIDDLQMTTVPEPGTAALLALGAIGMAMSARRRQARAA